MSGRDPNSEAYQILADLMVTIRRIIHRGLVKVSGETWYLDGCPEGLFEKLVERKEQEKAIDRFGSEYQELITFASLDDLAAIVDYNAGLKRLLGSLATEGSSMVERLRQIEALRLKMAASVPFEDGDIETLNLYHQEFRDALLRKKRRPKEEAVAEREPEEVADESGPDESAGEEIEPDEGSEPEADAGEEGLEGLVSDGGKAQSAGAGGGASEFGTQAATFEELVEVVGGAPVDGEAETVEAGRPDLSGGQMRGGAPVVPLARNGSESQVIQAELAMAEDDNARVLKVLHGEVTAVAEGAYRNMLDIDTPVWDTIRSSGWYDMKKAELALAPLELFYAVVARAAEIQRSGAGLESVKESLEEAEFSKLLLSLREVFLRHSH